MMAPIMKTTETYLELPDSDFEHEGEREPAVSSAAITVQQGMIYRASLECFRVTHNGLQPCQVNVTNPHLS